MQYDYKFFSIVIEMKITSHRQLCDDLPMASIW